MIEHILFNDDILAIIVRHDFKKDGVTFITPDEFSQQIAFMKHPSGKVIEPHIHNMVSRKVFYTQEVLMIKSGKLKVDFYDYDQSYLESRVIGEGDLILLARGGHGFEVLEDLEMVEVKQGPYSGAIDKTRFIKKI